MPPTYEFHCSNCPHVTEARFSFEERPLQIDCEDCGGDAEYRIGAPLVMRASYPDGTKRRGWADLKEASKLNKMKAGTDQKNRGEITAEIRKLGVKLE